MQRLTAALLVTTALALPLAPPASAQEAGIDFGAMSESEKAAFGSAVRDYLLENPEVIFEAIQILEERRNTANATADAELVATYSEALFDDGFSWVGGNPDGDVTIVEFLDYRCGYCKRAHPHVKEVLERDGEIRYIVKEFPILGPDSVAAGRMALAALEIDPGLYRTLNDELMSFQGNLTESIAYRIAAEVGYEIGPLKERAAKSDIEERLKRTYELADAMKIQGTPSFVIGDQIVRGFVEADTMLGAVEEERRQAAN